MSTTTTTARPASAASTVAASDKFKAFAIAFAIAVPIIYTLSELLNLPVFTFHPATNRFGWGWEAGRSGEGPAMYWYGWTVGCLIGGAVVGMLATRLPDNVIKKIPLALVWILPLLVFIPLTYSLMPFWTK